jgi:hypothetical protein
MGLHRSKRLNRSHRRSKSLHDLGALGDLALVEPPLDFLAVRDSADDRSRLDPLRQGRNREVVGSWTEDRRETVVGIEQIPCVVSRWKRR